ncbi:MAG: EamA family transporter [Evtepia sp.]
MLKKYKPYLFVLSAAFCWGVIGIFTRNLGALGISAQTTCFFRNMGTLIILGIVFCFMDRSLFRIKLKHLPFFFGTGVLSVLFFSLCYFNCQAISSLAIASILLYTAPTFVVIFSTILFRDRITKYKILALVITFLGCSFVSGIWSGELSLTPQILLFGLGSGFFYSLYSIFARYALLHYRPFTVTFYTFLFAGIGSLFLDNPITMAKSFANPTAFLLGLGILIISTIAPYLLYTLGLAEMNSGKASILASIEPVVAAFVGILVFGESLTSGVILGLFCILTSVFLLQKDH